MKLEVIATTLKEALDIEKAGADRIELVTGMAEGGLTPSIGLIKEVTNKVKIPVMVMLRPHSKSFIYNEDDIKTILSDLKHIKTTKAKGVVFGALNEDLTINEILLQEVINNKGHLKLTFHRAIDNSISPVRSLKTLLKYDVDTILTSAGPGSALNNVKTFNEMVKIAKGSKIKLLAGSGLNKNNVKDFLNLVNVNEVHIGSGCKYDNKIENEIDQKLIKEILNIIKK